MTEAIHTVPHKNADRPSSPIRSVEDWPLAYCATMSGPVRDIAVTRRLFFIPDSMAGMFVLWHLDLTW